MPPAKLIPSQSQCSILDVLNSGSAAAACISSELVPQDIQSSSAAMNAGVQGTATLVL